MTRGAKTPEELETLLEDAFVIRDRGVLVELFEPHALLAADGVSEARGPTAIEQFACALWTRGHVLLAQPGRVLQAGDTALVVAQRATSVVRRDRNGAWRYAISLLEINGTNQPKGRING